MEETKKGPSRSTVGAVAVGAATGAGLWADLPGMIADLFDEAHRPIITTIGIIVLVGILAGASVWLLWSVWGTIRKWWNQRPAMRFKKVAEDVWNTTHRVKDCPQLHRMSVLLGEFKIPTPPVPTAIVKLLERDDETVVVWREFLGRLAPYAEIGNLREARQVWPQLSADIEGWKQTKSLPPDPQ